MQIMQAGPDSGRRKFFALAAGAALSAIAAPAYAIPRIAPRRALAFHHLHTGEALDVTYWAQGHYQPDALHRINRLLRDFRTGDVYPIDRRLLDVLAALHQRLRSRAPFLVVSGYRSPATNAMLASLSEGVATNSLHLDGRAIDVRLPDRPLGTLHSAALGLQAGGVGYYPHSDFVHLDVGPVRRW
jgi:uncharacterized protein YcbK (DUF882 family)